MYVCMYIYIYISHLVAEKREPEEDRPPAKEPGGRGAATVTS